MFVHARGWRNTFSWWKPWSRPQVIHFATTALWFRDGLKFKWANAELCYPDLLLTRWGLGEGVCRDRGVPSKQGFLRHVLCSFPLARLHLFHSGSCSEVPVPSLYISWCIDVSLRALGAISGAGPAASQPAEPCCSHTCTCSHHLNGLGQKQWMPTVSVYFVNPLGSPADNPDT